MSANITIRINRNLTEGLLECSQLAVHHFVMHFNDQLSPEESQELTDHVRECDACQLVFDEVQATLKARSRPSRVEQLSFLRNLCSVLWTLENEAHDKFLHRHRVKTKKRMAKLECRVRQLEKLLQTTCGNASLQKEVVSQ